MKYTTALCQKHWTENTMVNGITKKYSWVYYSEESYIITKSGSGEPDYRIRI